MRVFRTLTAAAVLAASLTALPYPAVAQTRTYTYKASGTEVTATSTTGRFVGVATGSAFGTWYATVNHTPLGPGARITAGGSFGMVLDKDAPVHVVKGQFSGGSIAETNAGANCTNQVYEVTGQLVGVPVTGTGTFVVTLTHRRQRIFGTCLTYAGTVTGVVTLP